MDPEKERKRVYFGLQYNSFAFEKCGGLIIRVSHHLKFDHKVVGFILAMGFVEFSRACQ